MAFQARLRAIDIVSATTVGHSNKISIKLKQRTLNRSQVHSRLKQRGHLHPWAPAEIFPEGGKTAQTDKNDLFFGANENFRDFFGALD